MPERKRFNVYEYLSLNDNFHFEVLKLLAVSDWQLAQKSNIKKLIAESEQLIAGFFGAVYSQRLLECDATGFSFKH